MIDPSWFPIIVGGIGAGLFTWQIKRISTKNEKMLYDTDGEPLYMKKKSCEKEQEKFKTTICKKIDGVLVVLSDMRGEMKVMDEKREDARTDIAEFIGSVKQYIEMNEREKDH